MTRGVFALDMAVHLFTSIPPRLADASCDPSSALNLQKALVQTWQQAGFTPVSINSAVEHERHPGLREMIASLCMQTLIVERPDPPAAAGGSGRLGHLCTLSEFLAAIHRMQPAGAVAIINADIGMSAGVNAQGVTTATEATAYLIGQRLDVSEPPGGGKQFAQAMDVNGVDFVAFRSESVPVLQGMLPVGLRFGLPWWDHYLSLSLLMLGYRPRLLRGGSLWHVRHAARWSLGGYTRDGLSAARQFAVRLRAMPQTLPVCTWLHLFHARFHPDFAWNWRDQLTRHLIQAKLAPESLIRHRVGVLAGQTMSLLLQAAAADQ